MGRFIFGSASFATYYVDLFSQMLKILIILRRHISTVAKIYNTFVQYVNGGVRTDFCKTAEDILN